MPNPTARNKILSVRAYAGDAKTLLAFDIPDRKNAVNLAGFTIQCQPKGKPSYYLFNTIKNKVPADHAQIDTEPAASSINSPFHKFRWLHIPGSIHQGLKPFHGPYTYTVTPRYFDDHHSMLPIDSSLSVSVDIDVVPFAKGDLELGFTRGFTQSQAFDRHFGLKAKISPPKSDLIFDTSAVAGTNDHGETFTFQQEYEWLGYTAREKIFTLLQEVKENKKLTIDVFAYDLNEPDFIQLLLEIGKDGRARVILDNADLHHDEDKPKPEDQFETKFIRAAGKEKIKRGKFGRYAHNKVLIVKDKTTEKAVKVLTGSTNFSVTGLYVNSNHILIFNDRRVAETYADVFQTAWDGEVNKATFSKSAFAVEPIAFTGKKLPDVEIGFSPHPEDAAEKILDGIAERIASEGKAKDGSVLFAVMELAKGSGPVLQALKDLHANQAIFSYGITDSTDGISLYSPRRKTGVLVTGKPTKTKLPPPFNQVRSVGLGHQVHHKFIVCGFNGKNPVVYCGSSNLALAGEQVNGDNLIAIHDGDVATAFAIEALALVDHFNFLDKASSIAGESKTARTKAPAFASKEQIAANAGFFLSTTDRWVEPYYDTNDLHYTDRLLFR